MELQTPEELQWISNVAHWIEGGMFGVVALIAFFQALGYAQSKCAQYLWPGLILVAGVFLPAYILLQRGLDGIGITWSLVISDPQQREHFLMSLLLLAIGSVETLIRKELLRSEVWKFVSPVALVLIGVLLLFHTEYGTPEAIAEAARKHTYMGFVIIVAGLLKAAEVHWRRRLRWLAFPWIVLLFIAAVMLITYREPPGAYKTATTIRKELRTYLLAPATIIRFTFARRKLDATNYRFGGSASVSNLLGCSTADNSNSNANTTVTASPSATSTPSNANEHANMNASEHANMNMANDNKHGNMNMANYNMNANKKP